MTNDLSIQTLIERGNRFVAEGNAESAKALYEAALACDPCNARAHYNLGVVLYHRNQLRDAIDHYCSAIEAQPGFSKAHTNLGNAYLALGDRERASSCYREALAFDPNDAHARFSLALIDLMSLNFAAGWDAYEWRLKTERDDRIPLPLATLQLSDWKPGIRVALRAEQGIGDQLLYSTLLPELLAARVTPVIELDPRLVGIYRASLPGLEAVPLGNAALMSCEYQTPLASLPRILRRSLQSFAGQPKALLAAPADRVAQARSRLAPKPTIAISWCSHQRGERSHLAARKSASLQCFSAFAGSGYRLLDLQYGAVEGERLAFDAQLPGLREEIAGLDRFNDLAGMLASIEACDLVITTSNVTAHLAGAIGKRTWLVYLRNIPPLHYWVTDETGHSLWYPSVEICTAVSWIDWDTAFSALAERLEAESPGR